jgi:hypothetical protein
MASAIIETIQACGVLCELRTPATPQPEPIAVPKLAAAIPGERPNTKRVGELAEAAFLHKAEILGLKLAKPWGDSNRYDFILDNGQRCLRIQVKCTQSINARSYQVQSTYCDKKKKAKYTAADVDILVAYVIPLDLWYVVPVEAFPASASLRFYPHGGVRHPRFEQYREAWHHLRPK